MAHSDLEPNRFQREVACDILKMTLCRNMEDSDLTDKVQVVRDELLQVLTGDWSSQVVRYARM